MLRKCFADSKTAVKYSSSYTKVASIITGVLAPQNLKELKEHLSQSGVPYSISTDASNHKALKMFPLMIRYFDLENGGVMEKLIEFEKLNDEKSITVAEWLINSLQKFGLKFSDLIAFCADNASVNFGGKRRNGNNNIYARLQEKQESLLGVGCADHILHNTSKSGCNCLSIDIEAVLYSTHSHFSIYTNRTKELADYCDFCEIEYKPLLTGSKTRWLSFLPAIERCLEQFDALCSYFQSSSPRQTPRALREFWTRENYSTKIYLQFLQFSLKPFTSATLKLEKAGCSVIEGHLAMKYLRDTLYTETQELYCGSKCENSLEELNDSGLQAKLRKEFAEFYTTALQYIEEWYNFDGIYEEMGWLELASEPAMHHTDVNKAARLLQLDIDKDELYRELVVCRQNYSNCKTESTFANLPLDKKWVRILSGAQCGNMLRIVSAMFAIPASNAPVERVFSLMELQWTNERNRLEPETVKALLIIKINYDLTCTEMHSFLLKNRAILKMIGTKIKYL